MQYTFKVNLVSLSSLPSSIKMEYLRVTYPYQYRRCHHNNKVVSEYNENGPAYFHINDTVKN